MTDMKHIPMSAEDGADIASAAGLEPAVAYARENACVDAAADGETPGGADAAGAEGEAPESGEGATTADDAAAAGAYVPEPKVLVIRDLCLNTFGASCQRCVHACPKDALTLGANGVPVVNTDACTLCGICLGICDAFSTTDTTMQDLCSKVTRVAMRDETAIITCPENIFPGLDPAQNVVIVPCLAALSPEFWTRALSEGVDVRIACDFSYCADCDRAAGTGAKAGVAEALYEHAIATAEEWSGRAIGFADSIPEKVSILGTFISGEEVDRRGAFTGIANNLNDMASGKHRLRNSPSMQMFYEQRERMRANIRMKMNDMPETNPNVRGGISRKVMMPKRRLLLEALDKDASIAPRVPVHVSTTDCSACTASLRCTDACPTGARIPDPITNALRFDTRLCVGCGLCVPTCEHGAISMIDATAEILLKHEPQMIGLTNIESEPEPRFVAGVIEEALDEPAGEEAATAADAGVSQTADAATAADAGVSQSDAR